MSSFLSFLWDVYSFPFKLWNQIPMGCYPQYGDTCTPETGARVMAVLIGLFLAVLTWGLLYCLYAGVKGLHRKYVFWTTREHCQHEDCGKQWTTDVSAGIFPDCQGEQPCCGDCRKDHYHRAEMRSFAEKITADVLSEGGHLPELVDAIHDYGLMRGRAIGYREGLADRPTSYLQYAAYGFIAGSAMSSNSSN